VSNFRYVSGEYAASSTFDQLKGLLGEADSKHGTAATACTISPPSLGVRPRGRRAGQGGCNVPGEGGDFCRLVVEKPYGHDLSTALDLDAAVHRAFDEDQIFRIDHYMGKETVQNVLALRFANAIFEPIWNRRYVENIQITVAESIGVEHRGGFYETAGALRDIVQNHVMQVLALTLMESPTGMDADHIRDEKVKLLRAVDIRRPMRRSTSRCAASTWRGGRPATGGRLPPGGRVDPHSETETFVALRLRVENWRWPACRSTSAPASACRLE